MNTDDDGEFFFGLDREFECEFGCGFDSDDKGVVEAHEKMCTFGLKKTELPKKVLERQFDVEEMDSERDVVDRAENKEGEVREGGGVKEEPDAEVKDKETPEQKEENILTDEDAPDLLQRAQLAAQAAKLAYQEEKRAKADFGPETAANTFVQCDACKGWLSAMQLEVSELP